MSGRKNRDRRNRTERRGPSTLDRARDELFSAIRQCAVIGAPEDDQRAWMAETVEYMAGRHPELSDKELVQLKEAGMRFCQPVIPHGKEHTALSGEGANAA
jgi:hypothetical protein